MDNTENLIALAIICTTVLALAFMGFQAWVKINEWKPPKEDAPEPEGDLLTEQAILMKMAHDTIPEPPPEPDVKVAQNPHAEDLADPQGPALAFNPMHPPEIRRYSPRPGSTAPTPSCVCHQEPIQKDHDYIWWPIPGSKGVKIFCPDWYDEHQQGV